MCVDVFGWQFTVRGVCGVLYAWKDTWWKGYTLGVDCGKAGPLMRCRTAAGAANIPQMAVLCGQGASVLGTVVSPPPPVLGYNAALVPQPVLPCSATYTAVCVLTQRTCGSGGHGDDRRGGRRSGSPCAWKGIGDQCKQAEGVRPPMFIPLSEC